MTDPEDRRLTHNIAGEQARVIDITRRIQRGEIVGNESQIPKVSTFVGPEGANFRYVVVVKIRDTVTGATRETLHEFFEDVPTLSSDIRQRAISQAMAMQGQDTITGSIGIDRNWGEAKGTIISVTQRL